MARLQLYDNAQVAPAQLPSVNATAPQAQGGAIAAQQIGALGQQVTQTANTATKFAMDVLEQQNTLRVNAAMNQARAAALDLEYGDNGFRTRKGENAMPDAFDGKPLTEAYLDQYRTTIAEVEKGLGNDAQRLAFRAQAGQLGFALRGQAETYELEQTNVYGRSVLNGGLSLAAQEAATAYDNPDRVRASIAQIGVLGNELLDRYDGLSGNERTARVQVLQSSAVVDVVKAAADKGDVSLAQRYMAEFNDKLTAADRTKIDAIITPAVEGQMAREIADRAMRGVAATAAGAVDVDKAFNILIGTESNGKQFDAQGRPLRSPVGATGVAQVMEGTGPEAARLAGLPWDRNRWQNDPAYNRELGRAYFAEQVKTYGGDVRKAWAAYNAGPRWVTEAVARAERATPGTEQADWFWQLNNDRRTAKNRAETKAYVEKNWTEYGQAGGSAPTSRADAIRIAEAQLPPGAPESLRQRVRQEVDFQFTLGKQEADAAEADALSTAYRVLAANGGNMSALTPSQIAAVGGEKLPSLINFSDSLRKDNGQGDSDLGTYYQLSNPQTLRTMTDTAFVQAMSKLNESDRRHFAAARAQAQGTTPARENDPNNLPSEVIGRTVTQFATEIGLRTTGNGTDAQRIGTLRRAADQAVLAAQTRAGRRLSDGEVIQTISGVFNAPGQVGGWFGRKDTERAGEITFNRIPGDVRRSLSDGLKRTLGREPSETEVEIEYLRRYSRAW